MPQPVKQQLVLMYKPEFDFKILSQKVIIASDFHLELCRNNGLF